MNKHEHPPTPTIEGLGELRREISDLAGTCGYDCRIPTEEELDSIEAKLTPLITKAEQQSKDQAIVSYNKLDNMGKILELKAIADRALVDIHEITAQLKATTQLSYSPAPGTDGDT